MSSRSLSQTSASVDPEAVGRVLASIRVVGAVLSLAYLEEPFTVTSGTPATGVFHAVLSGSAWAWTTGAPEPAHLAPGQVAIFPSGAEHLIASRPEPAVPAVPVSAAGDGPLPSMHVANGGPVTRILCGTITFDESPIMSVAGALPDMVVTGRDGSAHWVRSTVELIAEELDGEVPASGVVAARLADVLVVRALREMVGNGLGAGWAAGLQDPYLARALAAIHGESEAPWTVAALAQVASMSRSSFYQRFTTVVGLPPGEYLSKWRIHLACGMLRESSKPVSAVARAVGFSTDAGFSTAFKRLVGTPPSAYRAATIDRAG